MLVTGCCAFSVLTVRYCCACGCSEQLKATFLASFTLDHEPEVVRRDDGRYGSSAAGVTATCDVVHVALGSPRVLGFETWCCWVARGFAVTRGVTVARGMETA